MPTKHTAEVLDISGFIADELKPVRPLRLQPEEVWRARVEPINFTEKDGPLAWSLVRAGDLVSIPLIPYRVHSADTAQLLIVAMDVMQRYVECVPAAVRTHLIIGTPIEESSDDETEGFRVWIGFAAQMH